VVVVKMGKENIKPLDAVQQLGFVS